MGLHTLLYTSAATHEMNMQEIKEILVSAREFNTKHQITGLLLYHDRTFMQVLEGEQETIHELFDSICDDDRHTSVSLTWEEAISTRTFPDWAMGFRALDEGDTERIQGYSRFFDEEFQNNAIQIKSRVIKQFLLGFREEVSLSRNKGIG